jgi:hypothetical protein
MSPKKATQKSAKSARAGGQKSNGFTAEERSAMKERAREAKGKSDGESAVLEKIAEMPTPIVSWPSGSTQSSRTAHRPPRLRPGTACPPMPRTARSSASSKARTSSSEVRDVRL